MVRPLDLPNTSPSLNSPLEPPIRILNPLADGGNSLPSASRGFDTPP
jgi:hypothetical protein